MITLTEFVILTAVVYRATRFVQLDTMFEDTRDLVVFWLDARRQDHDGVRGLLFRKMLDGITCAFCVSVWFAILTVVAWALAGSYSWTWESPFVVFAVAAGAMAWYRYIDPPE